MDFFDEHTTIKTSSSDDKSKFSITPKIVLIRSVNKTRNTEDQKAIRTIYFMDTSQNKRKVIQIYPSPLVVKSISPPNNAIKLSPENRQNIVVQKPSQMTLNTLQIIGIKRSSELSHNLSPPQKKMKIECVPNNYNAFTKETESNPNYTCIINSPSNQSEYNFDDVEFGEFTYTGAYSDYQSSKIRFGKSHPSVVVESKSLSTEESPAVKYQLQLPSTIIDKAILSNVQLEAVIYACQRHEEFLTDGRRAGYFIGDGAGVGKGRTVAGIIYENFLKGHKKAIWISVSSDLREDAKRDLNAFRTVTNIDIKVKSLNKMSYLKTEPKQNERFNEGVLFVTYSSLIRTCTKINKDCYKSRFDQVVKWFGKNYDGVIILDECHKAKNLNNSLRTKTGTIVKKLQDTLKQARIVYASATGASEPKHMAYMVRLGLWGPGRPFQNFEDFENRLTNDGVGAMELVAMEMKRKGMYLARQLSFEDVKFEIKETKIENCMINGHAFTDVYNKCVQLWNNIYKEFKEAMIRNKNKIGKGNNSFETQFWSAHQRFFKYLCISAKVQECVNIATDEIQNGKCIVIGLQTTGESSIVDCREEHYGDTNEYVSNAKGVLKNLIKNHYPSLRNLKRNQEAKQLKLNNFIDFKKPSDNYNSKIKNKKPIESDYDYKSDESNFSDSDMDEDEIISNKKSQILKSEITDDEKVLMNDKDRFSEDYINQQKMLNDIKEMDSMFPINPLDQLIREFGGPANVAELTGRRGRMVEVDGNVSYQSRREGDIGLDQINLVEKDRFNNGEKLVAIISDASSTGISLHSDSQFKNNSQRFHITLELPWSADKAIQQFGRTHRSNQTIAPHYMFLISDLPGERRFAATVAKRLESLGALTHGDRRCADTRDFSQFNLDNEFGSKAVKILINTILKCHVKPNVPFPVEYLRKYDNDMDKFKEAATKALVDVGLENKKIISVTKFLNRMLGIELDMQNALFQYFMDIIKNESDLAKLSNKFDYGIRDVINEHDNIFKEEPEIIHLDSNNKDSSIKIFKVTNMLLGISWNRAEEIYFKDTTENMFCQSNCHSFEILALAEHQEGDTFKLITPNFPVKLIDRKSLYRSYTKIDYNVTKKLWEHLYQESEHKCFHGICKQSCILKEFCPFGKRTKVNYIITGDVFLAWKKFFSLYSNTKMEIVRVQLHDRSKLVGALISPRFYQHFKNALMKSIIYSEGILKHFEEIEN